MTTTTAGASAPPYHSDLVALVALVARHDALRARYIEYGYLEAGEQRWEPTSLHLAYHDSLDALGRALVAFDRQWGFTPELG